MVVDTHDPLVVLVVFWGGPLEGGVGDVGLDLVAHVGEVEVN